jgi:hypothetical protein
MVSALVDDLPHIVVDIDPSHRLPVDGYGRSPLPSRRPSRTGTLDRARALVLQKNAVEPRAARFAAATSSAIGISHW